MSTGSAIYCGEVVHVRHRPRAHRLRYRVFSLLLDLDELPGLDRLRLFGHNRRALFSFHDADHGDGRPGALVAWVTARLAEAGLTAGPVEAGPAREIAGPRRDAPAQAGLAGAGPQPTAQEAGWRIRVLCYPRILGYVFNPLTVYFCESPDGRRAMLYEVGNTFGERHSYIIPVATGQEAGGQEIRHACDKRFYVSPFLPMDCRYHFRILPPAAHIRIAITETDAEGPILYAAFNGSRSAIGDRALLRLFLAYPLMTLKVTAAIHWEALRLWLKRVPLHRHRPAAARIAHSVVPSAAAAGRGRDDTGNRSPAGSGPASTITTRETI